MAIMGFLNIAEQKVKLAWREQYITSGMNQKALALPRGIYRGFRMEPSPMADTVLHLTIDPFGVGLDQDSFAVYREVANGWSVSVRESATVDIDLAASLPIGAVAVDWYVYLEAAYAEHVATTAVYSVADEDPHDPASANYNPDAVVIGRLHMLPLAATVTFNQFDPAWIAWAYADRTVPSPTARETEWLYAAGDEPWGLFDGVSRWCTPTADQKDAMDNAAAPDAANPVATMDDLALLEDVTAEKVLGEPRVISVAAAAATFIDLDAFTYGQFYVGRDAVGSAFQYFDLHTMATPFPLVNLDGGWITVGAVCAMGGAVPVNPAIDADAAGFYPAAAPAGPGVSGVRLYLVFNSATATFTGGIDVWYQARVQLQNLDETPAVALPNAARHRYAHASEHLVRRYGYPPNGPREALATAGTAIRTLQSNERGRAHALQTDEDVCARAYWVSRGTDAYLFSPANTLAFAASTNERRMSYGFFLGTRWLVYTRQVAGDNHIRKTNLETGAVTDFSLGISGDVTAHCCDGRYLYLRKVSAGGVHRLYRVDLATDTLDWGVDFATDPAPGTVRPYGDSICVADDSSIAVNLPWVDLEGAPAATGAIQIRAKTNGALLGEGCGDTGSVVHPYNGNPYYASGPICSDGTNVYFTVQPTFVSLNQELGAGQVTIANPAAAPSTLRWWPTWSSPVGVLAQHARSLVYDGQYVWINGTYLLGACRADYTSGVGPDAIPLLVNRFNDAVVMGPAVFDGKYLYMGYYYASGGDMWVLQINPNKVAGVWTPPWNQDLAELVEYRWISYPQEPDPGTIFPVLTVPFGDCVFDGLSAWFFQADAVADSLVDNLQRLPLLKWW